MDSTRFPSIRFVGYIRSLDGLKVRQFLQPGLESSKALETYEMITVEACKADSSID